MTNAKLDQMISIAIQEAADSWKVAQSSTTQVHEWISKRAAQEANPGFSFTAFCENKRGNWVIA
jgi:hypothetical protein